ncbi:ABC transporter substrate-binding protein [Streptomyces sp. NPDC060194]|uniref:ABC transporter substrate-binding protein n=1 Tax=Streptomyces sp. NPDC060194 TaxID=3347069 RepID=UPI003659D2AF
MTLSPGRLLRPFATALTAGLLAGCGIVPGTGDDTPPVTVMTWAPWKTRTTDMAGMPALASAYARAVNADGGLAGHELRVLTCNERDTSIGAGRCARRAVAEGAVAVVGSYGRHADTALPILETAGIPYIGGYGLTSAEFAGAFTYPVHAGQAALLAGSGLQLAKECGRVALVRPDTLAGDALPPLIDAGLATAGRPRATDVKAPEDGSGFDTEAGAALAAVGTGTAAGGGEEDGGGCVMAALGARTDSFFDSFRRLRTPGRPVVVASVLGSVGQSVVNRSGGGSGLFEGAFVTGWYPVASDRRWDPMRKVISEHAFGDNRIDPADAGPQTTWIAYEVLRQAVGAAGGGEITAEKLVRVLDGGLKVDTGGLTPLLDWSYDGLKTFGPYLRVGNAHVTFQRVRDGELVASGERDFVDVTAPLDRARVGE